MDNTKQPNFRRLAPQAIDVHLPSPPTSAPSTPGSEPDRIVIRVLQELAIQPSSTFAHVNSVCALLGVSVAKVEKCVVDTKRLVQGPDFVLRVTGMFVRAAILKLLLIRVMLDEGAGAPNFNKVIRYFLRVEKTLYTSLKSPVSFKLKLPGGKHFYSISELKKMPQRTGTHKRKFAEILNTDVQLIEAGERRAVLQDVLEKKTNDHMVGYVRGEQGGQALRFAVYTSPRLYIQDGHGGHQVECDEQEIEMVVSRAITTFRSNNGHDMSKRFVAGKVGISVPYTESDKKNT